MDGPLPPDLADSWRRFFADGVPAALDGSGVCDRVYDHPLLFPLQRKREAAAMLRLAASIAPRTVFEVGADKAGSLMHWCLLPSVECVIACEPRGTPYWRSFNHAFPHTDFLWLDSSSHDPATRDRVGAWLGRDRIDVLFLDGDKSAFWRDWEMYLPLMSPGGLVLMHDVQDQGGPRDAFRLAGRHYRTEEILDVSESLEAVEREGAGIPPATPHEGWLRTWRGKSCGVGVVYLGGRR
jgi:hypothetical protein